jgi:uncharacterized protein YggE
MEIINNNEVYAQLFNFLGDNTTSTSNAPVNGTNQSNRSSVIVPNIQTNFEEEQTIERTISVFGNATTIVKPDLVSIKLEVLEMDADEKSALSKNSQKVENVVKELTQSVRRNEIQVEPLRISFKVGPTEIDQKAIATTTTTTGNNSSPSVATDGKYIVSRTIIITTNNTGRISDLISRSVIAGVNRIDEVSFNLSNKAIGNATENLLQKAIDDGWNKAKGVAAILDVRFNGTKGFKLEDISVIPHPPLVLEIADSTSIQEWLPITSNNVTVSANVIISYLFQEPID